ncbi:MAG: Stealth CR1 domain-containing protein [Oscillospiraceae bacterium]|nr:Stealth CR1 domain-containing protein [Oscillospiraceae bacterium]
MKKQNENFDVSKPIDFVVIWVDGNDKEWQKEKAKYDGSTVTTANSEVRYRDWDNLQYWFRAVETYAPWVNKVHFVTWGHIPSWLNTECPKLNIVNHKDYIPEEYLPTFSSHTIELNIHRIKGLAEQFVYFNDDIFLNAPVTPEDFFKNGKPVDTAALDCIYFGKDSAGFFHAADITIINTYFKKKEVVKKDFKKWFNFKNGYRNMIKTAMLYNWPWFPGIFNQHVSSNFLKSTFNEVWEKEFDTLNSTCLNRFRKSGDVNQWVMKYWQLASGNFEPRSYKFSQCYHIKHKNFRHVCSDIREKRHSIICMNDTSKTVDFEDKKQKLIEVLEEALPKKSSFEK